MSSIKKIIIILFLSFPISNSFASVVTLVDRQIFDDGGQAFQNGIVFNPDGTKMFVSTSASTGNANIDFIYEYNLSTPFDISTKTYAGDDERCDLDVGSGQYGLNPSNVGDMAFSSDGLKIFILSRGTNNSNNDRLYRYDLTIAYDVSTCAFVKDIDPDTDALAGTSFGGRSDKKKYHVQGIEINPDGTKIFLVFNDVNDNGDGVKEYNLSTPYDIATMSLVTSGGIHLSEGAAGFNPDAIFIGLSGKRLFVTDHDKYTVTQFTLNNPYDTSSFTKDGSVSIQNLTSDNNRQTRALGFSKNGFKMFVSDDEGDDEIFEFSLACPFNIISGKCTSTTENKDRTGMALGQIEIAKRTIDHSVDTALNRLKWIRRNKDKQNLSNLNIDFNFTNQRLASLTELVKKTANKKKTNNGKDQNVFYWSEGSISLGKIGDTSISSTRKIDTNAITFGSDRFTKNNGIKGLAFRFGKNDVDVGNAGSNLDTDTYNITYYDTTAIKDDTKFLDKIFGIGKLSSDLLTVLDGQNLTAERDGLQMYGTFRIKDEIKKDNLILIPYQRIDVGHTILGSYQESGLGAINVSKQHVRSKKIRTGLSAIEDLSNDKYTFKRHGKLEYVADVDRSSNFKYNYVGDGNNSFNDKLHSEAFHNINGEIGVDIVLPDSFSIFLIYERNQAIDSGHTDKLHLAVGYLPNKETNFAFSIDGTDSMKSNYVYSKNINDYNIDLKLTNDLMQPDEYDEISFNLKRQF